MADAFNSLYGPGRCRIINNGIDMATEAILADLPPVRETQGKPKIAVVAHDLRYDGKTNQQLVREMMALGDTKLNCIPLVSSRRSPLATWLITALKLTSAS